MGCEVIPVIYAIGAGLIAGLSKDVLKELVMRKVRAKAEELEPAVMAYAAQKMGLELSESGNLTDESITAVVNRNFLEGSGFTLDSVLDREKMQDGLKRDAMKRLALQLGVDVEAHGGGMQGIKDALKAQVVAEAKTQLDARSGGMYSAAIASPKIAALIEKTEITKSWSTPTDNTPAGISNRLRQAKYRRTHRRVWVPKSQKTTGDAES